MPGAGFVANGGDEQDFGAQVDQAIALRADMVLIGASDNDLGRDVYTVSAAMSAAVERLRTALHARAHPGLQPAHGRRRATTTSLR